MALSRWRNRKYIEDLLWKTPEPEEEGDRRDRNMRKAVSGSSYCKYYPQGIVVFLVNNLNIGSKLLTDYFRPPDAVT